MVWVSPTIIFSITGVSIRVLPPGAVTKNDLELLWTAFCVTATIPLSEPAATVATTCESLQLTTWPLMLPTWTPPAPCRDPKPLPLIVTEVPTGPAVGLTLVICGGPLAGVTLEIVAVLTTNGTVPDHAPACCTCAVPELELDGIAATICVSLQLTTVPKVVPSHTVPVPCVDPKPEPDIVTSVPAAPAAGDTLVSTGGTANRVPVLDDVPTVTTTGPVLAPLGTATEMPVSLHALATAGTPLNVTVLVPWVAPKLRPAIVTLVPTGPDPGDRFAMIGEFVTVKELLLPLATPSTVTTTLPVVAPLGTATLMMVLLQVMVTRAVGGAEFGDTLEPDTRPKETSVPPGAPAPVFPWDTCI